MPSEPTAKSPIAFRKILRSGISYRADRHTLYDFCAEAGIILVMRSNPPLAWIRRKSDPGWRGHSPRINIAKACLLSPASLGEAELPLRDARIAGHDDYAGILRLRRNGRANAYRRFFSEFDPEIRFITAGYESVITQWDILSMLVRIPDSIDIARDNPALACSLAFNRYLRGRSGRGDRIAWARRMAGRRRREIVGGLGFPDRESTVAVLRRIPRCLCAPGLLIRTRKALIEGCFLAEMRHAAILSSSFLEVLRRPELSGAVRRSGRSAFDELREIQHISGALGLPLSRRSFGSVAEIDAEWLRLRRFLLNYASEASADQFALARMLPLPPPPLPGTDAIIPITCARDLFDEAVEMRNCVFSWLGRLLGGQGRLGIYRVIAPGRATLAISRTDDGFRILDLRAPDNRPPSPALRFAINSWLVERSRAMALGKDSRIFLA
jgi:hypothetical protein